MKAPCRFHQPIMAHRALPLVSIALAARWWVLKRVATSLCIVLVASLAVRADDGLPIEVRDSIKKNSAGCNGVSVDAGFLLKMDVNGDGITDYVLSYGFYKCGENRSRYCGTGGCLIIAFVSAPGNKLLKVLDERVKGLTFKHISGRPAMHIERHGSACGKPGYQGCSETLYWNGYNFTPDH